MNELLKDDSSQKVRRVGVAMSGGVDSSVAALLLHNAGYEVVGLTMKHLTPAAGDDSHARLSYGHLERARLTAARCGFHHVEIDLQAEFRSLIIEPFCREYLNGRTPNPCIRCNAEIKLGLMLKKALSLGLDAMATGHYAQVGRDSATGRYYIARGRDRLKDQSYFLCSLSQKQLSGLLLPLGNYSKSDVRRLAAASGLPAANQPESQEICFVVNKNYADLVEETAGKTGLSPGPILNVSGSVLGEHRGIHHYTVGQRKGLNISSKNPLYVVKIDAALNAVIVGDRQDLKQKTVIAADANYMKVARLENSRAWGRIRYAHTPAPCRASTLDDDKIAVEFDDYQEAVAPGQALVLYDDEGHILAGGWM